jgi:DDE superfamily endonuclease
MLGGLARKDQRAAGELYVRGLLTDGRRKSMQPMAERLGWIISGCSSSPRPRPGITWRCGGTSPGIPRPAPAGGILSWATPAASWGNVRRLAEPRRRGHTGLGGHFRRDDVPGRTIYGHVLNEDEIRRAEQAAGASAEEADATVTAIAQAFQRGYRGGCLWRRCAGRRTRRRPHNPLGAGHRMGVRGSTEARMAGGLTPDRPALPNGRRARLGSVHRTLKLSTPAWDFVTHSDSSTIARHAISA